MRIIEINASENGAHRNQNANSDITVPEGWAIIPENMEMPATFPFVDIDVENGVVTEMREGVMPPVSEPISEPESETDIWAEMADAITSGVNSID